MTRPEPNTAPVSIIIPCGGAHAHYVGEAVASCYAQEVKPAEVIVADDCADPSPGPFQEPATIIRLDRHYGRSFARNRAVDMASSDWLFFLDADDWLTASATADFSALAGVVEPDVVCVYADYVEVQPDGKEVTVAKPEWQRIRHMLRNCFNIGLLVRRERFLAVGGFDEDMAMAEYWDLFLRLTASDRWKVKKNLVPFFRARGHASVSDAPGRRLAEGMAKVTAMISGGYYRRWRRC
jgi:glycosyltransferase involved in cell wall biosynthesis